jgi:dipeptidyl aminopeptidase/acylaminoacyl peptidase
VAPGHDGLVGSSSVVRRSMILVASVVLAAACSTGGDAPGSAGTPAVRTSTTATGPAGEGSTSVPAERPTTAPSTTAPAPAPTPAHPVSLPALMDRIHDGDDLQLGEVLDRTDTYTRYSVTYRGSGLTISGIMNVPNGAGPFPVVVLAHGYIDPDVYTTGRGLRREQDYLARRGYVVLHTDYRNHAGSDDDPQNDVRMRLGYTEDVINAVYAIKRSTLPYLDKGRVGLLGRSMGGGITYNVLVVEPGLVDAAVVYAPVSSDAVDNFDRWIRGGPGRAELAASIEAAYGSPEANPAFWAGVSPVTYFDRVTEPLLVHHGTADDTCPIGWSEQTVAALTAAGKDVTFQTYDGEPHAFEADWPESMERTVAFLSTHFG